MKSHNVQESVPEKTVVIGFTGDIMIGRLVNKILQSKDSAYPWGNMLGELKSTDLNIANLETTLTRSVKKVPKVFNFKSDPEHVAVLNTARIDVVSLANNHCMDFAVDGLLETMQTLDQAGIKFVGAGKNLQEAKAPVIVEKNGVKIGILGFSDNEPSWLADEQKPGINYCSVGDLSCLLDSIKQLKQHADVVVLSAHWGPNMQQHPTRNFIAFAHALVDSGVDIFHGHSAHVVQGIEIYKGKLIMYDTGDFVDDYMVGPHLRNDLSCFFKVTLQESTIKTVNLVPVRIDNMQVNKATGNDAVYLINLMKKLCAEFGTVTSDVANGLAITVNA